MGTIALIERFSSAGENYLKTREGFGKVTALCYRTAENLGLLLCYSGKVGVGKGCSRVACELKNVGIILNLGNFLGDVRKISAGVYLDADAEAPWQEKVLTYLMHVSETLANIGLPFLFLKNKEIYQVKGVAGGIIDYINRYALLVFHLSVIGRYIYKKDEDARWSEVAIAVLKASCIVIQQFGSNSIASGIGLITAVVDLGSNSGAAWSSASCCC